MTLDSLPKIPKGMRTSYMKILLRELWLGAVQWMLQLRAVESSPDRWTSKDHSLCYDLKHSTEGLRQREIDETKLMSTHISQRWSLTTIPYDSNANISCCLSNFFCTYEFGTRFPSDQFTYSFGLQGLFFGGRGVFWWRTSWGQWTIGLVGKRHFYIWVDGKRCR